MEAQHRVSVVSRDAIRMIRSVEQNGVEHVLGELRDFRWNETLAAFLPPSSEFSISWVRLAPGERLDVHVHPIQSLMLFYEGTGQLLGDLERPITAGDTVVVPPGRRHGFIGGREGLAGLSIQFGEGLYTSPEKPRVQFEADGERLHDDLMAHNRKRIEEFGNLPLFGMLADGTLEDERKRAVYLAALQIWVNGNQTLLLSRQASCSDPAFAPAFLQHMQEEIGHDVLHTEREGQNGHSGESPHTQAPPFRDAVMEAVTQWFVHQMFVLDNLDKAAVIHLVIENASAVYHRKAMPVLAKYVNTKYFEVHVEADSAHARIGEDLVRGASPRTYERLHRVLDEAWDMIGAMTNRLVELTRAAGR